MRGTRIRDLKLSEVVDADTIKVEFGNGEEQTLRLLGIDTEESAIGTKPVTNAGETASRLAKDYFGCDEQGFPVSDVVVDIEFETYEPEHVCLEQQRGNFGRLLCYVFYNNENYNLKAVQDGWSPYFVKYGRSLLYHKEFMAAEKDAQSKGRLIWDPQTNVGSESRDYTALLPWWNLRDNIIMDYRTSGVHVGVLTVSRDYDVILAAAHLGSQITVLCDLANGISGYPGSGALLEVGTSARPFMLWVPIASSAKEVLRLIGNRYAGEGRRGYVYVTGHTAMYNGKPEIILERAEQLSDSCLTSSDG